MSEESPIEFSEAVRDLIYARCGGYCEKCGRSMQRESMCAHHRKLKSQGGRGDVENGLGCHHSCHPATAGKDAIHANVKKALEMGWIVPSWGNPAECRLMLPNGRSVRLTPEGTYE